MNDSFAARELTVMERELIRWMLEHGKHEAREFLPQLERARVTSWRCPCGCATIDFAIEGQAAAEGRMRLLADFVFGSEEDLSGIFVFEKGGILSGLEVYGLAGDAPRSFPAPETLRPFSP